MHSLHIFTDFWVLSRFWEEHDYNTLPFERRFISQSFCKCDHGLSQESIRKAPQFICFFSFLQQITGMFFALLGANSRDKRKVSQRNLCCLLEIHVLKNLFS